MEEGKQKPPFSNHLDNRLTYKIVRNYFNGTPRTIKRGLSLEEAQSHCRHPETSSSTATSATARRRTAQIGPWFDSYTDDK
jgi:hypothetical protein